MGRLNILGLKHGTDKATYHQFCDFYETHLPTEISSMLEIGVMHGNSLRMWAEYYPNALVWGVENDRGRRDTADPGGAGIILADATNAEDVRTWIAPCGPFDVIIDDGSHMTADQQTSLNLLWPHLRPGGSYVIEDLHTSLMSNYVNTNLTTIEALEVAQGFGREVIFERVHQGTPSDLIRRSGFYPKALTWLGDPDRGESITAIIRKPVLNDD